jgi:hypothetical protein
MVFLWIIQTVSTMSIFRCIDTRSFHRAKNVSILDRSECAMIVYVCVCTDICVDNVGDDTIESLCGLHRSTFRNIYRKYCEHSVIIHTHHHLLRIFMFLKHYPTSRSTYTFLNTYYSSIKKGVYFLSSIIDELSSSWNHRNHMSNRTNHHFSSGVVGCIDTFPIVVYRPQKNQSLLYNGKYKQHVYK